MSIGEIKLIYKEIIGKKTMEYNSEIIALENFINEMSSDERAGVINVVNSAKNRKEALENEIKRVKDMMKFEKKYSDYQYICGIDEVGRGPLAGPVVTAAVVLPKDFVIPYLNDSKQVKRERREELYNIILENAIAVGVGMSSEKIIDEIGIQPANYRAMRQAIKGLSVTPDLLLNDAVKIPEVPIKQVPIIKGDTLSVSIAAASIIAKVTRDKIMYEYDEMYPEYGFASNVGYGTAKHVEALRKYGPCEIHRRTFITNFI